MQREETESTRNSSFYIEYQANQTRWRKEVTNRGKGRRNERKKTRI
jgi:hypothetical protein